MRKIKRKHYAKFIAVIEIQSFYGGALYLYPGVYLRPHEGCAKPDRVRSED